MWRGWKVLIISLMTTTMGLWISIGSESKQPSSSTFNLWASTLLNYDFTTEQKPSFYISIPLYIKNLNARNSLHFTSVEACDHPLFSFVPLSALGIVFVRSQFVDFWCFSFSSVLVNLIIFDVFSNWFS